MIENNVAIAEVFDLKDGSVLNTIELNKDLYKNGYSDACIITENEDNFTYAIMVNSEVKVFQGKELIWTKTATGNEVFAIIGYDYIRDSLAIGQIDANENKIIIKLMNEALEPFKIPFTDSVDMIIKSTKYLMIFKITKDDSKVIVHSIEDRTITYYDLKQELGEDFQVIVLFMIID